MANYNFLDLKNKTVIIIGGFGLIGKSLCKGFVNLESNVIIADKTKNNDFLNKVNKSVKKPVIYFAFDITKEKEIGRLIKFVLKKFDKIDVFINCSWPRTDDWLTNIENVSYKSVKKNITDNLGGYFNCTQKIALQMKRQKNGSIINFSSIYGLVGPTFSLYEGTEITSPPVYPLIKGGINTMTKYFASYFGKYNVRVNCISPGGIYRNESPKFVKRYSRLTPLGRMATSEDIVMPTLFLASDGSKYITGHNLLVDGGWTTH